MKDKKDNEPQYETTQDQPPPPDQSYEIQYKKTLDQVLLDKFYLNLMSFFCILTIFLL